MTAYTGMFDDEARRRQRESALAGSLKGATTGASIGMIGGAPGAIAGGIIGGGIGALGGALGQRRTGAEKFREGLLESEMVAAEKGQLGLSAAEKQKHMAAAQQAAGDLVGAQQTQLARQNMAGPQGFSGQQSALQRSLAGTATEAGAMASAQAEQLSLQQEQQRLAALRAQLEGRVIEDRATEAALQQQMEGAVTGTTGALSTFLGGEAGQALLEGLGLGAGADLSAQPELMPAVDEELLTRYGVGIAEVTYAG